MHKQDEFSRTTQMFNEFRAGRTYKSSENISVYLCASCGGHAFPMKISSLKKENMQWNLLPLTKSQEKLWVKPKYCFSCMY